MLLHRAAFTCLLPALATLSLAFVCGDTEDKSVVSQRISAANGGSLTSSDGSLTLAVPPGALESDTVISISVVPLEDLPAELRSRDLSGPAYRLDPDGLTFLKPVEVSLQLDESDLDINGEGAVRVDTLVSQRDGGEPEELDGLELRVSRNDDEALLNGQLSHFSMLWREKGFLYAGLEQIDPQERFVGQTFQTTISINIEYVSEFILPRTKGVFLAPLPLEITGFALSGLTEPLDQEHRQDFESGQFSMRANPDLVCRQPGAGSYSVHVTSERGPTVRVTIDAFVTCVAGQAATPAPTVLAVPTQPSGPTNPVATAPTGSPFATPTQPPAPTQTPAPISRTTTGTFTSTVASVNGNCPPTFQAGNQSTSQDAVTISGNSITIVVNRGTIQPDGSFSVVSPDGTFRMMGRINGLQAQGTAMVSATGPAGSCSINFTWQATFLAAIWP